PLLHRSDEALAAAERADRADHVVDPAHLARVAARLAGGVVDDLLLLGHLVRRHVDVQRRDPAVRRAPGDPQHARALAAEPDAHVRGRDRTGLVTGDLVLGGVLLDDAAVQGAPHDADRFLGELDGLTAAPRSAAHGGDALRTGSATRPEVDAAGIDDGERRGRLGGEGRRTQLEIQDVTHDSDLLRAG